MLNVSSKHCVLSPPEVCSGDATSFSNGCYAGAISTGHHHNHRICYIQSIHANLCSMVHRSMIVKIKITDKDQKHLSLFVSNLF